MRLGKLVLEGSKSGRERGEGTGFAAEGVCDRFYCLFAAVAGEVF